MQAWPEIIINLSHTSSNKSTCVSCLTVWQPRSPGPASAATCGTLPCVSRLRGISSVSSSARDLLLGSRRHLQALFVRRPAPKTAQLLLSSLQISACPCGLRNRKSIRLQKLGSSCTPPWPSSAGAHQLASPAGQPQARLCRATSRKVQAQIAATPESIRSACLGDVQPALLAGTHAFETQARPLPSMDSCSSSGARRGCGSLVAEAPSLPQPSGPH